MRHLRQAIKQRKPFESLQQEVFLEVLRTGHALVQDLVDLLKPYGSDPAAVQRAPDPPRRAARRLVHGRGG